MTLKASPWTYNYAWAQILTLLVGLRVGAVRARLALHFWVWNGEENMQTTFGGS